MTFNLDSSNDRKDLARLLADFQGYGVEYKIFNVAGVVTVTPTGSH